VRSQTAATPRSMQRSAGRCIPRLRFRLCRPQAAHARGKHSARGLRSCASVRGPARPGARPRLRCRRSRRHRTRFR